MRTGLVVALGSILALLNACGDDSSDASANADGGPGSGGSGGAAPVMDAGRAPLGSGVAGKACATDADCGSGTCAMQISGTGLAAQPLTAPGGYCTASCVVSADCGMGGACIGALGTTVMGQCHAACTDTAECREGYLCGGGLTLGSITLPDTCRPAPETDQLADDVAGAMCAADADCAGGRCLTTRQTLTGNTELPGGYCSGACIEDSHCGGGGVCLPSLLGGAGSCYRDCATDADCTRDGYRCRPLRSGIRGCNPAPDPLPDNTAGDACSADADCGGGAGTCASTLPAEGLAGLFGGDLAAPGGYCSQPCVEDADCGAGGACVGASLGAGTCFAVCTGAADCRAGYSCEARGSGGGGGPDAGAVALQVCAPEPVDEDAGTSG